VAGVTDQGFVSKSRDEILTELEASMKQTFGETFDVSPESPDGQLIGIHADYLATQWQMGEDAFNSYNPATCSGIPLDNAVRINGITRIIDKPTKANLVLDGVVNTIIPAGSVAETVDGIQFQTDNEVQLPGTTTATCLTSGAISINANEINTVVTSIAGWTVVNNPEDAITGIVRETDTQLRARRERSVVRTGTDSADAIISAIYNLNVENVLVIENDSTIAVDGVPSGAFETIVDGGLLQDIAEVIYQNKPIGIPAYGDNILQVTDSNGYDHDIGVSRPTDVDIEMEITVSKGATAASDANTKVQQAMVDYISTLTMGDDVIWSKLFAPATSVDQVECINIRIRKSGGSYQESSIEITKREKAQMVISSVTIIEV